MTPDEYEVSTLPDLFAANRWAHRKLFELARPLRDAALDREESIGLGTLRKTLFHVWGAEQLWLRRWNGESPSSLPAEEKISIDELADRFEQVHSERDAFLRAEAANDYARVIDYRTLAGEPFSNSLVGLALHVANHAVHHRAQALHFLKLAGAVVPGGLDYLFYRLAYPTIDSEPDGVAACRKHGLEMETEFLPPRRFDVALLRRWCDYGDWGMDRLLKVADGLSDADLDRDFGMGMGSLRKTLLHLFDAENWWRINWRGERRPFPRLPAETSLAELAQLWSELAADRRDFMDGLGDGGLERVVEIDPGGGPLAFRVGESIVQLCVHGTHHRAQAINLAKRLGRASDAFDFVVFVRENS